MKITVSNAAPAFEPIALNITIESEEELARLTNILGRQSGPDEDVAVVLYGPLSNLCYQRLIDRDEYK